LKNAPKNALEMTEKPLKKPPSSWVHKPISAYNSRPYSGFRCTHTPVFYVENLRLSEQAVVSEVEGIGVNTCLNLFIFICIFAFYFLLFAIK
jgi:hypothetical protein